MIRYQKASPSALSRPGPERVDQLQLDAVGRDRLEPLAQELRVEPDLERLSGVGDRERLACLADVLALRRDRQLALREPQPQRRVALRHHRGAADRLEQLRAVQLELDVERLRLQLRDVRELPVDPAGREPCIAGAEDHVVLVDAELHGLRPGGDAAELVERACRDDRLELRAGGRELGLLHGHPVRVGRGHRELRALEPDEDARQHRARLVARRGARDALHGVEQRRGLDLVERHVDRGQPREVLRREDVHPPRVRAGLDRSDAVLRPVGDRHLARGQQANDVTEQLCRDDDRAFALDRRRHGRAQRELHVRRLELEQAVPCAKQDAAEHLDGAPRRRGARDEGQPACERVPLDDNANPRAHGDVGFHHFSFKPFVVVIGSVDDGEDGAKPCGHAGSGGGSRTAGCPPVPQRCSAGRTHGSSYPRCLIRAVRSCTRLYTALSSLIIRVILAFACITVVWSRPPNSVPIFGSDASVSSRERYIATCRG